MKRPGVALLLVLILLLPILFMGAFIAIAGEHVAPSERALQEIPADLLPLYYAAAATCDGLDWTVLAAIHKVETNFGRGPTTSSKGAQGPMQFISATWHSYAVDGSGDGVANINNVEDAVYSAAAVLCANGAGDPARLADAIWNYNHSDSYVAVVLNLAAAYGVIDLDGLLLSAAPNDILSNPLIALTSNARADIEAGRVDIRVLAVLDAMSRRHPIGISVFQTGHSKYVEDTDRISNHFLGRAADVSWVGGMAVSESNEAARQLVLELASTQGAIRPDELGHPFEALQFAGGFSDADHDNHLHIGFDE